MSRATQQFFEENMKARMFLQRVLRHVLQQSSAWRADGSFVADAAPKAFWIVESLLVDLERDFEMAKTIIAAKKAGVA